MKLRAKTPEETAVLARQRIEHAGLRQAMESARDPIKEDWRKAQEFASLVNYATAPVGAKKFDASTIGSR
jgi:hypothetical protein